ncbi:MAG TPA: ImmA/IrrE family metallo-endopeptidase [Candidatus Acidoferrales bacterium]|nr:ImmA/IrrE family metallo-endopeptidase [Candidatus Acidoferrales bacterium]
MTKQEISELGEQIAQKYNPQGLSPFPFEKIQEANNDLKIYIATLDDQISGAIGFNENVFNIFINNNKPKTRQHFTTAHEVGHYFLHKDIIKKQQVLVDSDQYLDGNSFLYRLDSAEPTQIETEANNFAASLIMPEGLVRKAWESIKNIEECAKIFNVSTSAMSVRLERLTLIT